MFSSIKKFISTHFVNKNLSINYKSYILQSLLIFICISLILLLGRFFDEIIVASLGASSFILFASPHVNSSQPRYVIGGYFWGLISGVSFNYLYYKISGLNFIGKEYVLISVCAMAVAVTAFLMATTNLVHPPAAALALGLSTESKCFITAIAAIISIIILCTVKQLLKKYLKNLV